jgi:large subunit ribosomal protein L18
MAFSKLKRRQKIKSGIRKKISGTADKPRLTVYRSNKEIYAQIVNDVDGVTLASAGSLNDAKAHEGNKVAQAGYVGKKLAELATKAGVETVVFDRNGYLYHGRVKALADGAREGGLKF